MSTTKVAAAPKFSSAVKPTSFSLHPETVARLRLTSASVSKKVGRTISMSKIVERAVHSLMDNLDIRPVKRVNQRALDEVHTARARKRAAANRRASVKTSRARS